MRKNPTQLRILFPGILVSRLALIISATLFLVVDSFAQSDKKPDFKSPHGFMENKGQIVDQDYKPNPSVKYLFCNPGFNVQLRQTGFSYDTYSDKNIVRHYHRVDVEFLNCNREARIIPVDTSICYFNYFTTGTTQEGVSDVHYYGRVIYKNIYPNIDVEFFSSTDQNGEMKNSVGVKYNFIVHPSGKISDIKLQYQGADDINLLDGKIRVRVASGIFDENIPESFFQKTNEKIDVVYSSLGNNVFSFALKKPTPIVSDLIIDPVPSQLWGTYYGSGSSDQSFGMAHDASYNIYVTGLTASTSNIATAGAWQTTQGGVVGTNDVFVAKFNSTGTSLLWGTYYGGTGGETGEDISVDASGNVYVSGLTSSPNNIATLGAWQTIFGGNNDAFIAKFNSTGTSLLWGTYYGSVGYDESYGLVLDASNNIYITGSTENTSAIATAGAWQNSNGGLYDAFIAKFNSTGTTLLWGTYYGGTSVERGNDIAIDASNNIYVAGYTDSPNNIASAGEYQTVFAGNEDVFLAKFNSAGSRVWGTYYGGTGLEEANAIAIDASNNIYLAGITYSTSGIATAGAYQTVFGGGLYDSFVAKFNSTGSSLTWGTYYGGSGRDEALGLCVDVATNVFVCGRTFSTTAIATAGSWQTVFAGGTYDTFIGMFTPSGSSLVWGTYYGGTGADHATCMMVDGLGNIFLTGYTFSSTSIATAGAWRTASSGSADVFVAEFSNAAVLPVEWLYFNGEAESDYNKLSWATATETNNDYFTLLRSTDGLTFSEIGRVDGSGTSSMQHDYSFNDMEPAEGINYYQLKQTDFNGQFKYSQIIALEFHSGNESVGNVYPNPTNGNLSFDFVSTEATQIQFVITDLQGKIVADENEEIEEGKNKIPILLSENDAGIYILRVMGKSGELILTKQIVKY
jgi:hypothetical protein